MEGSVRTEQALLEELRVLHARVAALELEKTQLQQIETAYNALVLHDAQELAAKPIDASTVQQASPFEVVFETITDGLIVYDQYGQITRMNAAFYKLLGLNAAPDYTLLTLEQRGSLIQLSDEKGQPLAPERWPASRILRGEVLTSEDFADIRILTPAGRTLQVNVNGAPMFDRQHNIVGAVAIFHDVTERRKLEKRTRDVLKALLTMAEVLVQGSDQASADEHVTKPAVKHVLQRLMKLARRILVCQSINILLLEAETEQLQPVTSVGTSRAETEDWQKRFVGTRLKDHITDQQLLTSLHAGSPITLDLTGRPDVARQHYYLVLPMLIGNRLMGLLSLDYGHEKRDLSLEEMALAEGASRLTMLVLERERLLSERAEAHANELALLDSNRRMDEFLSIASHEIRTPLTTINGNIQLAKRRVQSLMTAGQTAEDFQARVELIHELLGRAERQVRIQNRLVGDLLDVSRIQSNRLELHMLPCSLRTIVQETVADQRMTTPARAITLEGAGLQTPIPILADADRISQVVNNYLTNALKYSAADHPVAVCVEIEESHARVSVRDEGPGITPVEQERLWQRFYRVPGINVQSGSGVGLGLGLHICRTIIERHNGYVGLQSEQGKGSTFWFSLPIIHAG